MSRPIVFLSYSHDSDAHRERVLALSERLRADGFETRLDRYINGTPREGWPRWMLNQLDAAAFVLVVCTETYYRRFRGHEEPGKGNGADWEGALITNELYAARSQSVKFVPVLFAPDDATFIPEPLRGVTRYPLFSAAQYEALHALLSGQAGIEPGSVGEFQAAARARGRPLVFHDEPGSPAAYGDPPVAPVAATQLTAYLSDFASLCLGPKTTILRLVRGAAGELTRPVIVVAACVLLGFLLQLPQVGEDGGFVALAASMSAFKVTALMLAATVVYLMFRMLGGSANFAVTFSAYLYIVSPLYLLLVFVELFKLGVLRAYDPVVAEAARLDLNYFSADAKRMESFMTAAPALAITYSLLICASVFVTLGWFVACWGALRELHRVTRWRSALAGIGTLIAALILTVVARYVVLQMFGSAVPPLQ